MAIKAITTRNPLPTFNPASNVAQPGFGGFLRLRPTVPQGNPLPSFNAANAGNLSPPGGRAVFPIRPLPGTSGGGAVTVGYPT